MSVIAIVRNKKGKVLGPIGQTKVAEDWTTGGVVQVTGYKGTVDFWTTPDQLRAMADKMEKMSDDEKDNIVGFNFSEADYPLSLRVLWKINSNDKEDI